MSKLIGQNQLVKQSNSLYNWALGVAGVMCGLAVTEAGLTLTLFTKLQAFAPSSSGHLR